MDMCNMCIHRICPCCLFVYTHRRSFSTGCCCWPWQPPWWNPAPTRTSATDSLQASFRLQPPCPAGRIVWTNKAQVRMEEFVFRMSGKLISIYEYNWINTYYKWSFCKCQYRQHYGLLLSAQETKPEAAKVWSLTAKRSKGPASKGKSHPLHPIVWLNDLKSHQSSRTLWTFI